MMADKEQSEIEKYGCTKAERDRIQRVYGGGRWEQTPFGVFSQQRYNALQRGYEWNLRFHEWWEVWYFSGKWSRRGMRKGRHCMSRLCHDGPYEVGNVHIVPAEDSVREAIAMRAAGVDGYRQAGQHLTDADKEWLRNLERSLP